jgi:hypothetical protein
MMLMMMELSCFLSFVPFFFILKLKLTLPGVGPEIRVSGAALQLQQ